MKKILVFLLPMLCAGLICAGSFSPAVACEKEMARALGIVARDITNKFGLSLVTVDVDRLSKGQAKGYTGKRFAGVQYIWAALPYDERTEDLDMYVFDAKSEELIAKDDSSSPSAMIISTQPTPYTFPVKTIVKMSDGSGCFAYIVFSDE